MVTVQQPAGIASAVTAGAASIVGLDASGRAWLDSGVTGTSAGSGWGWLDSAGRTGF